MTYEIENGPVLVAVSRAGILDIAIGDLLRVKDFPDTNYTWTQQDSELVENNPDAELYLKIEKSEDGSHYVTGIELR